MTGRRRWTPHRKRGVCGSVSAGGVSGYIDLFLNLTAVAAAVSLSLLS